MWFSLCFQVDKAHPDVLTVMLQLFDEVVIESLQEREGEREAGKGGGGGGGHALVFMLYSLASSDNGVSL